MAGGIDRPTMSVEELEAMVESVGYTPIERDSHYNRVERQPDTLSTETIITEDRTPEVIDMATKKETTTKRTTTKPRTTKSKNTKIGSAISLLKRKPVMANILYMGIVGVLLIVAVYIGLKIGTRHSRVIEVPNFMGMTIDNANNVADDSDLQLIVRDSIFDVALPGGTIVDQLPKISPIREVTVKPGRKVYVTINAYTRRKVDVPYVAKQTLRQALNQIERSGLTIDRLVYKEDMTSTDYVVKQSIGGDEILPTTKVKVPAGTGVTLQVSYQEKEQYTSTPRLIGLSLQQAKNTLWDNGLNVADVVYDDSVDDLIACRKAKVYKQTSKIGTQLRRGKEVSIYLTCDKAIIDSMNKVATNDIKELERLRREAIAEREREKNEVEE